MTVRTLITVFVLAFCCTSTIAEEKQKWTVVIKDNTAVIRATSAVKAEYIQGTISAIQKTGITRFALAVPQADQQKYAKDQQWFEVQVENETASILAAEAVQGEYIVNVVKQLKNSGIKKIRFAAPDEN